MVIRIPKFVNFKSSEKCDRKFKVKVSSTVNFFLFHTQTSFANQVKIFFFEITPYEQRKLCR